MTSARTRRILLLLAAALAAAATLSVRPDAAAVAQPAAKDDAGARAAFRDVYKVLMHPRCRKYALKCANCHQHTNLPGANMPPGNSNWHLPKKDKPLVYQGKSPRELADQLKDSKRNGGRTLEQLVEHVTNDKLVLLWCEPGDGPN